MTPELKTFQNIFLTEDQKALLDLCPERAPNTNRFAVRLHNEAGNELAETSFSTEEEATKFIDFLTNEATLNAIKALADRSDAVKIDGLLYDITEKDFTPDSFRNPKTGGFLKLHRTQSTRQLYREELPLLTITENKVFYPNNPELAPLEFFKLSPAHL